MPRDALGRDVSLARPPRRIVSLVPSETETVVDLASMDRLVGRTEYCVEPAGAIEAVPTVGGTKSVDVSKVLDLKPDLVLANKEENAQKAVRKLIDAGLAVHVSFPCTVTEALHYLVAAANLLHVDAHAAPIARARDAYVRAQNAVAERPAARVFVPIWKEPWMTFDGRTFASDILDLAGLVNVYADRPRRYPLAADVGDAPPLSAAEVGERDTRYPRTTLDEIRSRAPELVLLPDEPYAFTEAERAAVAAELPSADVRLCDGKDLFWYGTRVAGALDWLRDLAP